MRTLSVTPFSTPARLYHSQNGMNRYGLILDDKLGTNKLLKELIDRYIRPLAHALFPQHVQKADTCEFYAFTVEYETPNEKNSQGGDVSLAEHRDASVVTLNINLNEFFDEENGGVASSENKCAFEGSALRFVGNGEESGVNHNVSFTPGLALVHLGAHRHSAYPISRGHRTNLIIWLFGKDGYVRFAPYQKNETMSINDRWGDPKLKEHTEL